ncbi:hypothetical protein, partial [Paraburkholderia caribensis]|uniref:hypothetical protein n=1 Tax=Paraburkholderia caribensis TaxID=75105 RepID=UPI002091482A
MLSIACGRLWFEVGFGFGFGFCLATLGGVCFFAGLRDLSSGFMRWRLDVWLCAGIRFTLARFTRRPCAGRHLLFFAAAKKSR